MNLGKLSFGCAEIVQQGLKKQTSAITDLISDFAEAEALPLSRARVVGRTGVPGAHGNPQ